MSKFSNVFAAHPDAEKLFVVNGMPFIDEVAAQNFQRGTDHKTEVVERPGGKATPAAATGNLKVGQIKDRLVELGVVFDPKLKKGDLQKMLSEAEVSNAAPEEE